MAKPITLPAITLEASISQITSLDFWDVVYQQSDGTFISPGYIGPTYLANSWGSVFLNGIQSPGMAEVRIDRVRVADKKKGAGVDVGTATIHGILPSDIDIKIVIWTADQWDKFKTWISALIPKTGKGSPPAISCRHPVFDFHNISNLQVLGAMGPDWHGGIPRAKAITLKCIEWVKPATAKKNVSKTDDSSHGNLIDPSKPFLPSKNFTGQSYSAFDLILKAPDKL